MAMRKRVAAGATLVVLGLVGVGTCTSVSDGGDSRGMQATVKNELPSAQYSGAGSGGSVADSQYGADEGAATVAPMAAGAAVGETASAPLPQGIGAPKVIKTGEIEIEVDEGRFDAVFSEVPTLVAGLGGFVSSSTSSSADDGGDDNRQAAGSIVLRVPAEQFDAVRTKLVALGELRRQQVKGDDVSAQLTDLDARLRNLRSQEEAMRLLMTKAKTLGETVEVQRELGNVRGQIEQLAAEQLRLTDAVAMSTITLHLAEPGAALAASGEASPLGEAFARAFRGAQHVVAGVIVSLGYLLPLALLAALGWFAARPFVQRRAAAAS